MRKYPIGLSSFSSIRRENYIYIDKTPQVLQLVNTGKYYFLSRPRRFGKSLLVSTIEELFCGNQNLFKGLWIHDNWDWSQTNPVIRFNFAAMGVNTLGLEAAIYRGLAENAERLGVSLPATSFDQQFIALIKKAAEKGSVVILVDEYDKPLTDYLENTTQVDMHRSMIKSFYSVLKEIDVYIRFVFVTGVSRFSRVSIFSDLNNLRDITFSNPFGTIAGITQYELEYYFQPEIDLLRQDNPQILDNIRQSYNGYTWDVKNKVYNPFSLLNFMADPVFRNYWFTTGTPTFLIDQLKARKLGDMDGVRAAANTLADFNTGNLDMVSLLFQTGYLTIRQELIKDQLFVLGYPNREVRESLLDGLLNAYREPVTPDSLPLIYDLRLALTKGDVPAAIGTLNSLMGSIPYDHWRSDTESIFNIVMVLTFRLAGVEMQTEVHSARGRCDVLVKTPEWLYVIELKLDGSASGALEQILSTGYLQPYENDSRKKLAVGISFSSADRQVAAYEVREM